MLLFVYIKKKNFIYLYVWPAIVPYTPGELQYMLMFYSGGGNIIGILLNMDRGPGYQFPGYQLAVIS
jgi:hypothetical protein